MRGARKFAMTIVLGVATCADSGVAARDRAGEFTISFAADSTEPVGNGAEGERNAAAITRIGKALALALPSDGFKLVFLVPEPLDFELAHDRVKAMRRVLIGKGLTIEGRTGAVFRSFAVPGDFKPPPTVPADPTGLSSLHLRLLAPSGRPSDGCPWSVRIDDPELPPMIGTAPAPLHLTVGAGARIAVSAETSAPGVPRTLWSLRNGHLAASDPEARQPKGAFPPSRDATLHLVVAEREHAALRLIAELGTSPGPAPELARLLPKPTDLNGRGLGDIVNSLGSGTTIRAATGSALRHCAVSLAPRSN